MVLRYVVGLWLDIVFIDPKGFSRCTVEKTEVYIGEQELAEGDKD